MPERRSDPLRVVQVSFHADHERRDAESLLRAWPTLSAVAAGVARAGVDVVVVQTAHADRVLEHEGVSFHFVDDARPHPKRVVDCVASLRPNVVHVQGLQHPRAVRDVTRALRGIPVLIQDHGGIEPAGWRRAAWRWAFGSIAGVAFTTRDQAAPWFKSGVLRAGLPVFDVLEGSSSFAPADQAEARRLTGLAGDPCLLWTSRLDANKDPLMMLDAVEHATTRLPDLRLWCCFGGAPMLDVVRERIASSEALRTRVALLGKRSHDEMESLFRAADFYLQTSHREGSGFSLLEAMACGTVPIVTDIPPARCIVGDVGSLTPVGDASAMADALVAWNALDRAALRRNVRTRFERSLTFDAIGRQLKGAYETLIENTDLDGFRGRSRRMRDE